MIRIHGNVSVDVVTSSCASLRSGLPPFQSQAPCYPLPVAHDPIYTSSRLTRKEVGASGMSWYSLSAER